MISPLIGLYGKLMCRPQLGQAIHSDIGDDLAKLVNGLQ